MKENPVSIGELSSNVKYLNKGISQGSILGHVLFLIYINNIINLKFYANDTTVSYFDAEIKNGFSVCNEETCIIDL